MRSSDNNEPPFNNIFLSESLNYLSTTLLRCLYSRIRFFLLHNRIVFIVNFDFPEATIRPLSMPLYRKHNNEKPACFCSEPVITIPIRSSFDTQSREIC